MFIDSGMIHKAREVGHANLWDMNGFSRALSLWNPDLMRFLIEDCKVSVPLQHKNPGNFCSAPALASLTSDEVDRRFIELKKYLIWPGALDDGVKCAVTSKSIKGLRICLENQGNPNTICSGGEPVLYEAVRFGTNVGAEMAKLLLKYGAKPDTKSRVRHITQLKGMKKFETYFGGKWDDIVQRIQSGEDVQGNQARRPTASM
jgi:hypothetical protein